MFNDPLQSETSKMFGYFAYFFVLPAFIILNMWVLSENSDHHVQVTVFGSTWRTTSSSLMFNSMMYAGFLSASVFFARYMVVLEKMNALNAEKKMLETSKKGIERKLDALKKAAGKVLIPYQLDKLVDKNLLDFDQQNFRPGMMQAEPRSFDATR